MHIPVMTAEIMDWLAVRPGGLYLDTTVGGAGHSRAILERLTLAARGCLIAMDRDPSALELAREKLSSLPGLRGPGLAGRFTLVRQDFAGLSVGIAQGLQQLSLSPPIRAVDGILADIGLSQMMLDDPQRGFSLKAAGPLDMRMDPDQELTADEVVNRWDERELARVIYEYGEERRSQRIARAIVRARPITTTVRLAEIIAACLGGRREAERSNARRRHSAHWDGARTTGTFVHPATRVFQALRIAVNQELEQLTQFLNQVPECLTPGGRLVVISFHSLEDRIVKQQMQRWDRDGVMENLTRKVIKPGDPEIIANRRSRSAKLRAAMKPMADHTDQPQ
ncbi:MAG: 16S rRNA (cytosine(1402)-N(4))-methyltransferase [Acidobacteria bacterium]|nr:16S rRNA (cytosine(1402)-N(4))-methyltransferase [Acidobacteriota bacterium]